MTAKVIPARGPCRHQKYGRCTNHFWQVMKESGKPGLAAYTCLLWRAKLEALAEYHAAASRARVFGLPEEKVREIARRTGTRKSARAAFCPDFRPASDGVGGYTGQCRYFFLEACLLLFPECPGVCEDFLPRGDQT
ncbi:MAG: hypothetical protein AB1896_07545 [Thermodesulfobacteriota bacterium]